MRRKPRLSSETHRECGWPAAPRHGREAPHIVFAQFSRLPISLHGCGLEQKRLTVVSRLPEARGKSALFFLSTEAQPGKSSTERERNLTWRGRALGAKKKQ